MTTSAELKQIFKDCTLTHTTEKEYLLVLPDYQIEEYPKFKKMTTDIGGIWKRKGFLFTSNPSHVLQRIFEEGINWKKLTQFFATPHPVCRKMVDKLPQGTDFWHGKRILEPSVGRGNILMEILLRTCMFKLADDPQKLTVYAKSQVDVCETDDFNYLCLENKIIKQMGYNRLCANFLELPLDHKYHIILANPPFAKNQYQVHFRKMVKHLLPNGFIVCILPLEAQHEDLYSDLNEVAFESLDAKEFKKSGTIIDTVIVSARLKAVIGEPIKAVTQPADRIAIPNSPKQPAKKTSTQNQLTLF